MKSYAYARAQETRAMVSLTINDFFLQRVSCPKDSVSPRGRRDLGEELICPSHSFAFAHLVIGI